MSAPNTHLGQPVERVEDDRFLRGAGRYVADLSAEGMLHAVVVRSDVAHGRLLGIDTVEAAAHPGVHRILTAADFGQEVPRIPLRQQVMEEGEPYLQPVIATDRVRYVGEPLAVVLAADRATAEDAAALVVPEIAPLDVASGCGPGPRLFDGTAGNCPHVFTAERGDIDAAFAQADLVVAESFSVQRHTASPMETRGLFAAWDGARLTLSGAAKVPFFNRDLLATMLGLAPEAVRLVEVDVGGGFGARGEFYPEDALIAFAAYRTGRPVKWVEDRREHLMAMNHARHAEAALEMAFAADGTVLGVRGRIDADIGAYVRTNGFTAIRNLAQFLSGPYRFPAVFLEAAGHVTNKTPAGTYRGPGRFESAFFCERLMDLGGTRLGIDPADMRRMNLATEADMPMQMPQMRHADPSATTFCDGGAYHEVLERCLSAFDWAGRTARIGRDADGRWRGIGLGCFVEGGAAGPREGARITAEADGTVTVAVGSSALGQGLETVLSQIAADALALPMARIRLRHGSTDLVRDGFGSFHSRSTVMGGNAVALAAAAFLETLRAEAARRLGCTAAEVAWADGRLSAGGRALDLADFAALSEERSFANSKHTYSYGAHAVEVAVRAETGQVEILDYVTTEDVGRVVNPATLEGQVVGAVVQGLGSVFLEELKYDDQGQLLTGSFADYFLPTATCVPRIRSIPLGLVPSPNNPLGLKGAGEGGLIATGGAVANAIACALRPLGVAPNHLPLTPPRLWALIEEAAREAGRA